MANYVLQELPEELSDGKKIVYPKMQTYSLHDYETVIKHMRDYAGNFSEGMIRGVFDALVSMMESWMPLGHTIKIDGLGVFSLSLGFDESVPSEKNSKDKTKYRHVCIKGINFKPDAELLKEMNKQATFDRVTTDVKVPQKTKLSREERLAKAKEIVDKNGYMTLSDYANATGQSRSAASTDLRQIVADADSGIATRGTHSHKVWVAAMKKVFLFLSIFMLSTGLFAQTKAKWEDPYMKPDAPGYEDLQKSVGYLETGDTKNHIQYLLNAAQKDNLFASYSIALYMMTGVEGIFKADTETGMTSMLYLAQNGYAPAQYAMTSILLNDTSGPKAKTNKTYAIQLLKQSAEQGYLPARSYLGNCYLIGKDGIQQDTKKGLQMIEECASEGDKDSQMLLGMSYYGGGFGEQDYSKAYKWFEKAAGNGVWKANNFLAYLYAKGNGVKQNYEKAHQIIDETIVRARHAGELSSEDEAEFLDTKGEIFLMQGKHEEAATIWGRMKDKYPEYVEKNKYELGNNFVRVMYKEESENKAALASNTSNKSLKVPESEVDRQIPENAINGNPTFAIIIANENYKEVERVPYALHDGETFKLYCEKTLGIPKSNIKFVADATLNNITRQINWLNQVMDVYEGEANIIFYYAGHGIPDESSKTAYLLPVDGVGNDVSTGYSLDKLYADLSSKPAKSVVVLLDACFSGAKRDGGMIVSSRGVAIKAKQNAPKGNMVILSAAQGDETAYPYQEKGHGMFTYYLLKKIQDTKGNVTFGELADYLTSEVKKQSIIVNGKLQTPTVSPSSSATGWKDWKLR